MNNKDENCRNHLITHLRNVQLEDEYLKFKLVDMINAYRPHDSVPNLRLLKKELLYTKQHQERPLSFKAICKQVNALLLTTTTMN